MNPSPESQSQSKKSKRNVLLIRRIIPRLAKGKYPKQIAEELGISKQLCSYHIKRFEEAGLIAREIRSSSLSYSITPKGQQAMREVKDSSLGERKDIRSHNLTVKFPILKDNPSATFDKTTQMRNWEKKISRLPFKITIEKTPQAVIAYFHSFSTTGARFLTDYFNTVNKGILMVYAYLEKEKGIVVDPFNAEIVREHIANEKPELNTSIDDKSTFSIGLQRKARGVYPSMEEGRAWLDRSVGPVEVETNDLLYQEMLLLMPMKMDRIDRKLIPILQQNAEAQKWAAENWKSHKRLLEEMSATLKAIREAKGA